MPLRKPHEVEWDNQAVLAYTVKQAKERFIEEQEQEIKQEVAKTIAIKCKEQGLSNQLIAKATGLSIEEVEKL